jgi:hypothetical protein
MYYFILADSTAKEREGICVLSVAKEIHKKKRY